MQLPLPLTRDLVLIGGGHSHALLLRMWAMDPLPGVRLTLIQPGPTAAYSGMLPGFVSGHYTRRELDIDLVGLARHAGARFVDAPATGIDRASRVVTLQGHRDIRFDTLSVDIGITSHMPELPGFADHGTAAKPLDRFATAWTRWCRRLQADEVTPEVVVIGAGIAGVELALAMRHRTQALGRAARIRIVDAGRALDGVTGDSRSILFERLRRAAIPVDEFTPVQEVTARGVLLASGRFLPAAFVLGAAGARPHAWLSEVGLQTHEGFVTVDRFLRSVTDPEIFACGDCAHLGFAPRPKAGVYAVRAAPVLFHNLRAALGGGRMKAFRPQTDYLKLVSLGSKDALGDRSGVTFLGPRMWRLKDRIDRRFMQKLQDLPDMPRPALPRRRADGMDKLLGDKPLCGGCGAKVAGAGLSAALARLPAPRRDDVVSLPGDDAAILAMGKNWQVITTDHLRAFGNDPVTFARITAVHALGDIWAMGALPQAALANVTLPPMGDALQAQTLGDMLETASDVFRDAGADLVGGHTSTGAELSLGFTLTGLSATYPITLAGARVGDALLLTKPIGTGVILAGHMAGKTRGADLLAALSIMSRPQGAAARILCDARAMTDVTGFGLAGHLMGLCDASGVGAEITLCDVPLHAGAEALSAAGIASTLAPANRAIASRMVLPDGPRAALLFDPQTAGGLLAAVPAETAEDCLAQLQDAGFEAHRIGWIIEGPPFLTVL